MTEIVVTPMSLIILLTTGAVKRAMLQIKPLLPTNQHPVFFTARMPFLSPNQQCQSTEGKISHSMDLLTPSSPGGLPTLTTNSSWLPWGRVVMPLISPLMPVPLILVTTRAVKRAMLQSHHHHQHTQLL